MNMASNSDLKSQQQGVGLVEVLVALFLLMVSILGYTTLQVRALSATQEAGHYIEAYHLARDLSERIRVNPQGFMHKRDFLSNGVNHSCMAPIFCSAAMMAEFDFMQVRQKALTKSMNIALLPCRPAWTNKQCIYIAWQKKTLASTQDIKDCTQTAVYSTHTRCMVLEAYTYVD